MIGYTWGQKVKKHRWDMLTYLGLDLQWVTDPPGAFSSTTFQVHRFANSLLYIAFTLQPFMQIKDIYMVDKTLMFIFFF